MREYSTTWFISRDVPLFCRELKYVAKYAFYVLFFWLKSGIRANLYAFSISVLWFHKDKGFTTCLSEMILMTKMTLMTLRTIGDPKMDVLENV